MKTKQCYVCGEIKELDEFYKRKGSLDGHENKCKKCRSAYGKAWHKENREANIRRLAHNNLKSKYNLTIFDYENMLESQGSVCAICGTDTSGNDPESSRRFAIDHNHETGEIRGVLCHNCNLGLGNFRDNPESLQSAINYLNNPPARNVLAS